MLIVPYVCAEFHDRSGNVLFTITPDMLRGMQEVPESIKQDLLFDMLVKDGSIKTPETAAQKKLLEQDPMIGMNAEGKRVKETSAEAEADAGKTAKTGKVKDETAEAKPGK